MSCPCITARRSRVWDKVSKAFSSRFSRCASSSWECFIQALAIVAFGSAERADVILSESASMSLHILVIERFAEAFAAFALASRSGFVSLLNLLGQVGASSPEGKVSKRGYISFRSILASQSTRGWLRTGFQSREAHDSVKGLCLILGACALSSGNKRQVVAAGACRPRFDRNLDAVL